MGPATDEYWDYRAARWVRFVPEPTAGHVPAPAGATPAEVPAQRDADTEAQPAGG